MNWPDAVHQFVRDMGRIFRSLEIAFLCLSFIGIVGLGLTQIGLRNLADSSLAWSDAAMRAAVLWIAMIASCIAAGESRHIRIDLMGRLIPPCWALWIGRLLLVATALICIAMVVASLPIVRLELEFQERAFLNVPRWLVLSIIPIGFSLMAFRFMRGAVMFDPARKPEP